MTMASKWRRLGEHSLRTLSGGPSLVMAPIAAVGVHAPRWVHVIAIHPCRTQGTARGGGMAHTAPILRARIRDVGMLAGTLRSVGFTTVRRLR